MDLKKQIVLNTFYRIIFLFLQVIISFVIPRITGPEGFGLYSLVIANASLLSTLTSVGIPSGLSYHIARGDRDAGDLSKLIYWSSLIQLLVVILGEVVYHVLTGKFWIWPSASYACGVSGIVFFMSVMLAEKYFAVYNGRRALVSYTKVTIAFSLAMILALLLTALIFPDSNVQAVIAFTIIVSCLQTFFLARGTSGLFANYSQAEISTSGKELYNFFGYSIKSYFSNTLQFLANRIDLWILFYLTSQTELGHYSLASRLSQLYLILPLIFSAVIFPAVSSVEFSRTQLDRQIRLMNTLNVVLALLGIVSAFIVIPFFFGSNFNASIQPFIILVPGMLFKSVVTLLAAYFAGKGLVDINLKNSGLCALVVIGLDFILIPKYKISGAAIGITVANFISAAYAFRKYSQLEGLSSYRFFAMSGDILWLRKYSRKAYIEFRSK